MANAKVYFTDFRSNNQESMLSKLHRLMKAAGFESIDFENRFTAIKMHFGEPGNLAFLRPNYAKVVADYVKELRGKPFLTDSNTLYVGMRRNALDHLEAAYQNGFSPFSTGCHILIADGLTGTDEVEIPVKGEYVRRAKVGRAAMDADILISLTHFKGHEGTGFGGAIKNIGMGLGSFEGKKEMHSAEKPAVDRALCVGCGRCTSVCAHQAISIVDDKALVSTGRCVGCGRCIGVCPEKAIRSMDERANEILARKIAEYTLAILQGRPHFHISLIMDVSPYCDCHGENDAPIIPDVGMLASFDPVALDQACADLVNLQSPNPNSFLHEHSHRDPQDHFHAMFHDTDWKAGLEQAEKIGLGTRQYELLTLK